jgi:hypothetical protein
LCRLESAVVEKRVVEERYYLSDVFLGLKCFVGFLEFLFTSTLCV